MNTFHGLSIILLLLIQFDKNLRDATVEFFNVMHYPIDLATSTHQTDLAPLAMVHLQVRDGSTVSTGFSSEIGTKLRDWAVGQARGGCYPRAALSSNDSKTRLTPSCSNSQPLHSRFQQKS